MDPTTLETCKELQDEEWQALKAIYPELIPAELENTPSPDASISLSIGIHFPLAIATSIGSSSQARPTSEHSSHDLEQELNLTYLPPLQIAFSFPATYPIESPPTIIEIISDYNWLPSECIEPLKRTLLEMWDEGLVLSLWVDYIQGGEEMLSSLGLLSSEGGSKSIRLPHSPNLSHTLSSYNTRALKSHFHSSTHSCPICLTRLPGTQCLQLTPCNHVACKACLQSFWGSCIKEGNVAQVGCPDPDCVKKARGADMGDVKAVLSEEEVGRWIWLVRKQQMEKDPTITYCPLLSCQRLVPAPPTSPTGQISAWDRLRTCDCGYSFCLFCRRAWHGPHTPCPVPSTMKFVEEYLGYPEGSEGRAEFERRYGRNNVMRVIKVYEENRRNDEWMERETMACPGCRVRVQKNHGCNHMTCARCSQHFCYRCGARINSSDPYTHYKQRAGYHPCKLFDEVEEGDVWIVGPGIMPGMFGGADGVVQLGE
ncbi:hypothetical protein M422DRAFT_776474 [Sphaerobolus stellatus SS14]|nr:hypothetical protein M422DRAFT_776474 [Sphaerobolus stellatus SS14]